MIDIKEVKLFIICRVCDKLKPKHYKIKADRICTDCGNKYRSVFFEGRYKYPLIIEPSNFGLRIIW